MSSNKHESEWRANDDMHTLMEAEKIRKDPKRLKAAQAAAKKKLADIEAIAAEKATK